MITILTFLWKGWRPIYNYTHVNAWARMIRDNCSLPHKLVCITDDMHGIDQCETYPLWKFPDISQKKPQNSYRRLKLFDPQIGRKFGDRIISMDLDSVALLDIAPLISAHDFRAVQGVGAPLNGSMFMLKVGTNRHVWDRFDVNKSPLLIEEHRHNGRRISGSDQAWMSMQLPNAATWTEKDGIYQYSKLAGTPTPKDARIVFFAGVVKPWDLICKAMKPKLYERYWQYYYEGVKQC